MEAVDKMALWVVLGILVLAAFWMIASYNSMVLLRQNVRESWSAIETELRRRYDLEVTAVSVTWEKPPVPIDSKSALE